jgi:hypothetical protein
VFIASGSGGSGRLRLPAPPAPFAEHWLARSERASFLVWEEEGLVVFSLEQPPTLPVRNQRDALSNAREPMEQWRSEGGQGDAVDLTARVNDMKPIERAVLTK